MKISLTSTFRFKGRFVRIATFLLLTIISATSCDKYVEGNLILVESIRIEGNVQGNGQFFEDLAVVYAPPYWGYINKFGKLQIEPTFESAGRFSEGLAPVKSGGKFGYIDAKSNYVIQPKFLAARPFVAGLALVAVGDKDNHSHGFIRPDGQFLIESQYSDADDFSEGLAPVAMDGKWGYIDTAGKIRIPLQYEYAARFSEGLAVVKTGGLHGCIDKQGIFVIQPTFQAVIHDFHEGMARISVGGGWRTVTNKVGTLRSMQREWIPIESGFINRSGQIVMPPQYFVDDFHDGLAKIDVTKNLARRGGFVDKTGTLRVEARFGRLWSFSEGLAAASHGGKIGFIDRTGSFVIKPKYDAIISFSEGCAIVKAGEDWFVLKRLDKKQVIRNELPQKKPKQIDEKLADKTPEEIKDALKNPDDLIEGLGGLLGSKKEEDK